LRAAVLAHLDQRRVLGTRVDVRTPTFVDVSVRVRLRTSVRRELDRLEQVRQAAEGALYRYLDPYVGGPTGDGWPFGRELNRSELYSLLHNLPGVEYVDDVRLVTDAERPDDDRAAVPCLTLPADGLFRSGRHQVVIE
jgi:hypothetical protein